MEPQPKLLRFVFWNVHKKNLNNLVCSIAKATEADVIVLLENGDTDKKTLAVLRKEVSESFYRPKPPPSNTPRFSCFCKNRSLDLTEVHDGLRTSVRKLKLGLQHALLVLVHGVDIRNNDSQTRQSLAQTVMSDMKLVQAAQQFHPMIVLGDFNLNPFDSAMNLAAGFNAMMTRACVSRGVRIHVEKEYDFYYNPMWSLFGDNTEGPAGTIYDTSNQGPYGWNMFDQVLIHHSLVNRFESVAILTEAGDVSLMDANGRPDSKNASDHFPIMVTLRGESDV